MSPDDDGFGWSQATAAPSLKEVVQWLAVGERLTGAVAVIAECRTDLLEFVYIELRDGRLLISDRGETTRYLERGDDAHRQLDLPTIREVCERSGAKLVAVDDMWPHITVDSAQVTDVAEAVRLVAQAIDRVFDAALTRRA